MASLSFLDGSSALGYVGKFLNLISDLTVRLSNITQGEYVSVEMDGQPIGNKKIYTYPSTFDVPIGVIELAEGTHTVRAFVYRYAPPNYGGILETVEATFEVKGYTLPSITGFSAQRCDSGGNPKGSGTYVLYSLIAAIDPVTVNSVNKNTSSIKLRYRVKGTSTWTDKVLTSSQFTWNAAGLVVSGLTLPASNTYDFGVYVADRWKFAAAETALPRDVRPFNARMINGQLSTCIGTLADEAGKHKVVQPAKFTETVELVKAPVFGDPAATREALGIRSGAVSVTAAANTNTDVAISFSPAFASTPTTILVSCESSPASQGVTRTTVVYTGTKSASGFTARLQNSSGSVAMATILHWIAIQ